MNGTHTMPVIAPARRPTPTPRAGPRLGLPTSARDDGPPSAAGDHPHSVALAELRARLLRMILENERIRRNEKPASPR